ncbi:MAG: nucleotide exchange factor GrpE [Nitrospiraceae bacterium]
MAGGYLHRCIGAWVSKKEENSHTISDLEESNQGPAEGGAPSEEAGLEETEQAPASQTETVNALQDKYLRLAAEFENFKKLAQKQNQEYVQFANESMLKELLPVVDNLERAIKHAKESHGQQGLIQGVELTLKQATETLARFGVKPIASLGAPFDPAQHQAVARRESPTAKENTVIEEYQKGYLLHDRVLRAAMVVVASAQASESDTIQA